jgi:hypothetical protein
METVLIVEDNPKMPSSLGRFRRSFGFIMAVVGCAVLSLVYILPLTRLLFRVSLFEPRRLFFDHLHADLFIPLFLALVMLSIGFVLEADRKADYRLTKRKAVVLAVLALFYPSPVCMVALGGLVPPARLAVFSFRAVLGFISPLSGEAKMALIFFLMAMANFAIVIAVDYLVACFLDKHVKNAFLFWLIPAGIMPMSLLDVYLRWDAAGGLVVGNIVKLWHPWFI